MRISVDWLKDWVEIDTPPEELAEELTSAGLEVDSVEAAAPTLAGVCIVEVLETRKHPNADRLSLCRVSDGQGEREIVCGAPNVSAGIRVPYAPVGTVLPGGMKIKAAKIRGVPSDGMLCSQRELGLGDDASGLMILDSAAVPGESLETHLGLADSIIDIDLTPNRGDCFSVIGIAREVAAKHDSPVRGPALDPVPAGSDETFPVELVDESACARFAGRVIRGLAADAVSPDWLKERLRRAGSRPIHPVVDVTNYVMLELGQPLHAYSLAKLAGGISVSRATAGERLALLDGTDIELADDVLTINDASGPIGLAGIMGGASTAVDETATDIFLESAFFAPAAIQGRARRYGLYTDASVRFERGVDPANQARAIERATRLLIDIAGGTAGPTIVTESVEHLPARSPIDLDRKRVESLLGVPVDNDAVQDLLGRLGMQVERKGDRWSVTPPSHRFDIAIEEDLVEEIGRMIGYDAIPPIRGSMPAEPARLTERLVPEDDITDLLVERGYSEVITYSFIDEEAYASVDADSSIVRLANPLSSELGVLRGSLWPGLLKCARQNLSRQQTRCRLFEMGTTFAARGGEVEETGVVAGIAVGPLWPEHWGLDDRAVDFFDIKADLEALLSLTRRARAHEFRQREHPALNPSASASIELDGTTVGWLGAAHPHLLKAFDLKEEAVLFTLKLEQGLAAAIPAFETYSRYPSVRRDLAVVVEEGVSVSNLIRLAEEAAGDCLKRVFVFDLYRGESIGSRRKSVGLGLILQDASRTLTDNDADDMVSAVIGRLEQEVGAKIRT